MSDAPSQQAYRDKALRALSRARYELQRQNHAEAQVYALLAVSEALMNGYSGMSIAEVLAKMGLNDVE